MAVTTSPITQSGGVVNRATGGYTGTGSGGVTIPLGFTPTRFKLYDVTNSTDATVWEWIAGMGANMLVSGPTTTGLAYTASLITTDFAEASESETGVYQPGTDEAGDGSLIDTTVVIEQDVNPKTLAVVLASGLNTSAHTYLWEAEA